MGVFTIFNSVIGTRTQLWLNEVSDGGVHFNGGVTMVFTYRTKGRTSDTL